MSGRMKNLIHEPCWWYFTFGGGQKHAGHFVKFFGTWMATRQKMFDKYGSNWAFQYSEEEWESMQDNPWLETELIEDSGD